MSQRQSLETAAGSDLDASASCLLLPHLPHLVHATLSAVLQAHAISTAAKISCSSSLAGYFVLTHFSRFFTANNDHLHQGRQSLAVLL